MSNQAILACLVAVVAGAPTIPTKEIAPGVFIPLVGLGTWQYNSSTAYEAACAAFGVGYTYVDTAWGYQNEPGVGQAIKDCWRGTRDELFVMTKIPGGLNASEVLAYHQQNLGWLGLDYVDHLMTHFPCDWDETAPRCNKDRRIEEWHALEGLQLLGLTRSIGVSHYCPRHLNDILPTATIRPAINQVEYHIGSGDIDGVIDYCREWGISFQSYSPLCGPCATTNSNNLINGTVVSALGKKYGVSGPQIALRFIVQQALEEGSPFIGVIPKSTNPKHLQENMDLFSFTIDDADMQMLLNATQPAAEPGDCDAN